MVEKDSNINFSVLGIVSSAFRPVLHEYARKNRLILVDARCILSLDILLVTHIGHIDYTNYHQKSASTVSNFY